jgi:hypothetical protein
LQQRNSMKVEIFKTHRMPQEQIQAYLNIWRNYMFGRARSCSRMSTETSPVSIRFSSVRYLSEVNELC